MAVCPIRALHAGGKGRVQVAHVRRALQLAWPPLAPHGRHGQLPVHLQVQLEGDEPGHEQHSSLPGWCMAMCQMAPCPPVDPQRTEIATAPGERSIAPSFPLVPGAGGGGNNDGDGGGYVALDPNNTATATATLIAFTYIVSVCWCPLSQLNCQQETAYDYKHPQRYDTARWISIGGDA